MRQLSALSGAILLMEELEIWLKEDPILHIGMVMREENPVQRVDLTKVEHMVSHLEGTIHRHLADLDNSDLNNFLVGVVLLVVLKT